MGILALIGQASDSSSGGAGTAFGVIIGVAIALVMIASLWVVFTKAGQRGWMAIIPFLNTYVMVRVANRPWWWFLVILLVPCVGLIFSIIVFIDIAKQFGKSAAFGIGLVLLPFIFFPILAWGSAQYQGDRTPAF